MARMRSTRARRAGAVSERVVHTTRGARGASRARYPFVLVVERVFMTETDRISHTWRWLESNVANPLLRAVLRSPIHGVVSSRLMLLSYEGRRSGKRFTTPVAYERDGTAIVVTTFRESAVWWRNFQDGHPATIWIEGQRFDAVGRATTDGDAVADWLGALAERGRTRMLDFFGLDPDAPRAEREAAAERLVVVRFTPA